MGWESYVPMALQAGGALFGRAEGQGDRDESMRILEKLLAEYEGMDVPSGPPALMGSPDDIHADPRLAQSQMGAMDKLQEIADAGGLTLSDQVALNRVLDRLARSEGAGLSRIKGDMAARGQLNSGAELSMALANQQNSSQRAHETGMATAAQAQDRALNAILSKGDMAGKVRSQNFNEADSNRRAKMLVDQYNAGAKNQHGPMAQFDARLRKTNSMSNAAGNLSNAKGARAQNTGQFWADMGVLGGKAVGAGQAYNKSGAAPYEDDEEVEYREPI